MAEAGFYDVLLALTGVDGRSAVMRPTDGVSAEEVVHQLECSGAIRALPVPTLILELLAAPHLLQRLRQRATLPARARAAPWSLGGPWRPRLAPA